MSSATPDSARGEPSILGSYSDPKYPYTTDAFNFKFKFIRSQAPIVLAPQIAAGGGYYMGFTSGGGSGDANGSGLESPPSGIGSPGQTMVRPKTLKINLDDNAIASANARPNALFLSSHEISVSRSHKPTVTRNVTAQPGYGGGAASRRNSGEDIKDLEFSQSGKPSGRGSFDDSSPGVNAHNLKTTAINGVYKIMQDRHAQEHIVLQKYALLAIPSKFERDYSIFEF
jgi:hypothetical protein